MTENDDTAREPNNQPEAAPPAVPQPHAGQAGPQAEVAPSVEAPQTPAPDAPIWTAPTHQQPQAHQPYPAPAQPPLAGGPGPTSATGAPYAGGAAYGGTTPPPYGQPGWATTNHTASQPGWTTTTGAQPAIHPAHGHHFGPPRHPSKVGKFVGLGIGAIALSLCSGLVGGYIASEMNDGKTVSLATTTRNVEAAPVINRDSLATIASNVLPSVVAISTGSGEGSGVVFSADGYIITNNHVVAGAPGGQVTVSFQTGGPAVRGKVVGTDPRTDLGVVKVDGVKDLKPAKFGLSSGMQVGDTVLAIGSPLGLKGSVTAGILSNMDRTIPVGGENESPLGQSAPARTLSGLIQTDAPINPGNSGGALVNLKGEVIGINTAIATAGSQGNIGVGFAIPSDKVTRVADSLKTGQKVTHPYLGVTLTDAQNGGALVATVQPGSPADKAGLRKGDIVTDLGGKKIAGRDDLVSAVQAAKVGDRVVLSYVRDAKAQQVTVVLGDN